jgi:hypothetical protein
VAELLKLCAALGELVLDVDVPGGQQAADTVNHLGSKQRLPSAGGVLAWVEVVVDDLPQLVVVETGEDLGGEDVRRRVEEDGHGASWQATGTHAKPRSLFLLTANALLSNLQRGPDRCSPGSTGASSSPTNGRRRLRNPDATLSQPGYRIDQVAQRAATPSFNFGNYPLDTCTVRIVL